MADNVDVLILTDNSVTKSDLTAEHGLSIRVLTGGKNILFDTGQGLTLPGNATALGVDLSRTDTIVLSHGHFDHTGGLPHVFELGIAPTIFMHPDAMGMRYGCLQTPPHKPIGMRPEIAESLTARAADIVHTLKPTQIADRIWVTGPIPRRTSFEDTGGPFFMDEECHIKDPITDDQAIWIETAEGIVVLLGCAHSGVVNTLDYVAKLSGATQFSAIIGGVHLLNASVERLDATIDALKHYQVRRIAPCHCTGDTPASLLAERFPTQYTRAGAGSRFTWPLCG